MAESTNLTNLTADTLSLGDSGAGAVGVTGLLTVTTGLAVVTSAIAVLGEDPSASAGKAAHATAEISGTSVVLKAWQDDFVTLATVACTVNWLAVGTV